MTRLHWVGAMFDCGLPTGTKCLLVSTHNALVRRGAILLAMWVTYLGGGVPDLLKSSLSAYQIALTLHYCSITGQV